MPDTAVVSWDTVDALSTSIANRWIGKGVRVVYGVPMGGIPVAMLVARKMWEAEPHIKLAMPNETVEEMLGANGDDYGVLVVDDLVDSGRTLQPYTDRGLRTDALFRKPHSPSTLAPHAVCAREWLRFPWERSDAPEDAVVRLLQSIGENPNREGLLDTPRRVCKALREMTSGLHEDPRVALGTTFTEPYNEPLWVRRIRFTSVCEHHLLPFVGTCTVGYTPNGRVVGLSKIPRLIECLARRPQLQEQLTRQIADVMFETLRPDGVGVCIRAHHSCMGCRGVRQQDAEMITSCVRGSWSGDLLTKTILDTTL
jgi:GTP cyclohydrolase I